jgi:DNA-binding transcriptional regulator PaaX
VKDPRPFEPVSDLQLLAAIDRAERHRQTRGVQRFRIAEHLGFPRGPATTRRLRPQIESLIAAGMLASSRRLGSTTWGLTDAGRKRLARARRAGKVIELPESPQHRTWRQSYEHAHEHIDALRKELRSTLTEAQALLKSEHQQPRAWCELSVRLRRQTALVAWALYCLTEWAEPDDAKPDTDITQRQRELGLLGATLLID